MSNLNSSGLWIVTKVLNEINTNMKMKGELDTEKTNLFLKLDQTDKQEQQAIGIINTEILSKLNISLDILPPKCQELILKVATEQVALGINCLDPIAISLQQSRQLSKNLEEEYEILKLKLKNKELQVKIDRNQRFMDDLRKELESSIESLSKQSPNPDNIQECIKQMKQKVSSYEESYKKATMKFSKLSVPDSVLPKSLQTQLATLASLREEETMWRQRADDVLFTRQARDAFRRRK